MVQETSGQTGEGPHRCTNPAAVLGNPGDVRSVGEGVSEMRIDYGPGYRVCFVQREETLVILLVGGDKDSQKRDIRRALELARGL